MKRKANLIIAGVNKSATSSLFTYLAKHTEICGSLKKETCFFLPIRNGQNIDNINVYEKQFVDCKNEKYALEATPGYFYGGRKLATYIKEELQDVKIIFMFRNPIDRALSFYNHLHGKIMIDEKLTFTDCIEKGLENDLNIDRIIQSDEYFLRMIKEGFYDQNLEEWYDVFGSDKIKIVFFDDLKKKPSSVMSEICIWLGIEDDIYKQFDFQIENISVQYQNKYIHNVALKTYKSMEVFFRKNTKLKNVIRNAYYMLNAKKPKNDINKEILAKLESLYEESNNRLKRILLDKNYTQFPDWLSK